MEFEELQTVWDNQNNEALFSINKEALYTQIEQKSQAVQHKLHVYERLMFIGNLILGIVLFVDALQGDAETYEYVLPLMYIAFSVGTLVLRRLRRKQEVHFELTVLGELDKAIWQIDYLIKQGRAMMTWYVLPLMLVLTITMILNSKPLWALGLLLIVFPFSYFAGRWEINKWHLPQKRELESLREELTSF